MKINNETKVGIFSVFGIGLLLFGLYFLKGKSFIKTGNFLFAKFTDTKGILVTNSVLVKGFQVGTVYDIQSEDESLHKIIVTIKLNGDYKIPKNSKANIAPNPLGSPSMEITLGDEKNYFQSGDTITTVEDAGLLGGILSKLTPVTDQATATMKTLDSVLNNFNSTFDTKAKLDLQQTLSNINKATAVLAVSINSFSAIAKEMSVPINSSLKNMDDITKNLAQNDAKINSILSNVDKSTKNLASADLAGSVAALNESIAKVNVLLNKVNSTNGSLGLLLNDKTLYNNLTNTVRSSNILLDDLRAHPKRYVSISVFGGKDKTPPLTAPLEETTPKKP